MKLTEAEQLVLKDFLDQDTPLRAVIAKFVTQREQYMRKECTDAMAQVPRKFEIAADFAARADVYTSFFPELESFLRSS